MDVAAWLRDLGLGQYASTFRESEIEADVLPELTEADLEKLGPPLGPRKRIPKAIANLGDEDEAPRPTSLVRPSPKDAAERRQLTVMFCDLSGSTALSARLDPEDMRHVIRAYQDACSGVVARYDGFLAKFMGDGILAYFGFPNAHEDDAERAVRAALEIVSVVGALRTRAKDKLQVRIGIATGLVVSVISWDKVLRRSRPSWATRPISQRVCKGSLCRARSCWPSRHGRRLTG